MPQENVRERADEETIPPLPDAENDDIGTSMIDETAEEDAAVENRLEAEDEEFKDEMKSEAAEGESDEVE